MENTIILFALPVFAILIAAELLYGHVTGRQTYRLNDSISSLSQGLLSQAVAVCTQLFQVGLYTLAFSHVARLRADAFWDSAWGWVAAVVLFDFCDYWLHRAGHEVAIFWAAHVVHHQSEDFNFSTALRQESLVPLLGWMFYLPMALLGVPPAQFVVAGLIVLLYQFWIHTEHVGKLGWFDRVFSSPSNHRVHHAINPQYLDKNYGGMLIIWDRIFGTFAEEEEACIYGTKTALSSWNPLWAVASVYAALAQDAARTRRLRDKLRIWFMPTGWRPADLIAADAAANAGTPARGDGHRNEQGAVLANAATSGARPRYDPPLDAARAGFAVLQLGLMTGLTGWLLLSADDLPWIGAAGLCGAIAGGLWLAGAVMESRLRLAPAAGASLALLLLACCALPAHADATLPDRLTGNIGAGIYASQAAAGVPHESPLAFPFIYADYGRLSARVDTFGVKTVPAGYGYLELAARVSTEGSAAGTVGVRRLPGRANPLPVGLGTFQETPIGGFFLYGLRDLRSRGTLFEASYAAELAAARITFYPQLGVARRSARYEQQLHGVTPRQATELGVQPYAAGASVTPFSALAADVPLSGPWMLNLEWRRDWPPETVRNSPLGGSRHLDSGFLALSHSFK